MYGKEVYYKSYLGLDKILNAQDLESEKNNHAAHDEMLFIIVHQAYELWFKQILHELNSIVSIMSAESINDNSPALHTVVHRLGRVIEILKLLVQQITVIETMTPLDFLDFRDDLRPASGFQSYQFKMIEAALGLKFEQRHGQDYYMSHLKDDDKETIKEVEEKESMIELVNKWLERMPYFDDDSFWEGYEPVYTEDNDIHPFWSDYEHVYSKSLISVEQANLKEFASLFLNQNSGDHQFRRLSPKARRSALFIMLYRDYPILQNPYKLLNSLLEIDELMATWRYRHMNMVHRMIGTRVGTGGSSGKDYLRDSMDKHYIFSEIAELTSFLIDRRSLPKLSKQLEVKLGFD